jgi:hypothetical protein
MDVPAVSATIDHPGRFFTNAELALIWHATNMAQVRNAHRSRDDRIFTLLSEVAQGAFAQMAVPGHEPGHSPATEERSHWTVEQLARASRRGERTIRRDIENNELAATRPGHAWVIPDHAARAYIAAHRKN